MNVGWSAPQIVNLDFQETGIRSRQQPLQTCRPDQGKRRRDLKVRFDYSSHGDEWQVLTFTADSNGHVVRGHDRQLSSSLI